MVYEIWLIPFFGQGHLLPTIELCKQILSRNFKTTLIISSDLSSNIPSSLTQYPLFQVAELPSSPPPPPPPHSAPDPFHRHLHHHSEMAQGIEDLIAKRSENPDSTLPICAVVDVMMSWTNEIIKKFQIPTIGFFTSGACSAAMEYAIWKNHAVDLKPGEIRLLPGLPEDMALTDSDLKTRPHGPPPAGNGGGPPPPAGPPPGGIGGQQPPPPGPPPGFGRRKMGPPQPGAPPPWLEDTEASIALMMNTCNFLERPFIEYLTNEIGKPVWGVGPLLPEQFWKSTGSILQDNQIRANRRSNVTQEEVLTWLDAKAPGSVLYIAFGTEVGPTIDEYTQLADALEASNRPFIWAIQLNSGRVGPPSQTGSDQGYFPHGLQERVGKRGLIIHGWAPQLLILSHPSIGGFLSHCGWNSSVEAIGGGKAILGWPIRGDQYYNAQLIVKHLKIGFMISNDFSRLISKDDIIKGIERLIGDEQIKNQARLLSAQFENGFPISSISSLDAFRDFIIYKKYKL
ncbi:hypothetical protein JCGZ_05624 [Jatropha curcas]|uniref:Glycosyltransferase n=1 Tax=Jatropha curcas TaxID=180498 RepID=A0A067L6W0_JATCU|nr:UDP-glycosyltransferase 73B4 [Jatropha curcas]KDP44157.1 hypothetical protein JCGZ_05624 [Jatropha curcas]